MTTAEWAQFVGLGIAGAFGLLCLFDGTRRLAARQASGSAGRFAVGAVIVALLAGYAYWQHRTYTDVASSYRAEQPQELPADWGKKMNPAKREAASKGIARGAFIGSGTLTPYVDAAGQRKVYAPAQEDLKRREAVLATAVRLDQRADSSFNELVLWLVLGLSAFVFGLCFAFEPAPKQAGVEEHADAPPVPPA
jgi:hypothetical protein